LTSTKEKIPDEDFKKLPYPKVQAVIRNVISRGHLSVLEHANFTFKAEGVSRALTHELVRHRQAAYTQQSQRYVSLSQKAFVKPETVNSDQALDELYEDVIGYCFDSYKHLLDKGVPPEDARYVLPNATHSTITFSMNARGLLHFFSLRCCNRAQWEIRGMADEMLAQCKEVAPTIFEKAGPGCVRGKCPEGKHSCGKPRKKEDLFAPPKTNAQKS
jgi:thymidylate synthase (FAD)